MLLRLLLWSSLIIRDNSLTFIWLQFCKEKAVSISSNLYRTLVKIRAYWNSLIYQFNSQSISKRRNFSSHELTLVYCKQLSLSTSILWLFSNSFISICGSIVSKFNLADATSRSISHGNQGPSNSTLFPCSQVPIDWVSRILIRYC